MGRIGRRLAEKAAALGMDVRHHDPFVPGGVELDALLGWADAVSLHLPLTDETRGLIDARRLGLMRPGAILVNTARGPIVDREALKAADPHPGGVRQRLGAAAAPPTCSASTTSPSRHMSPGTRPRAWTSSTCARPAPWRPRWASAKACRAGCGR